MAKNKKANAAKAARTLGCSVEHLEYLVETGTMPADIHGGKGKSFDLPKLQKWHAAGCPPGG